MENGKVIQLEDNKPQPRGLVLTAEEKKRLVDFFSILIEIDQRGKRESNDSISFIFILEMLFNKSEVN